MWASQVVASVKTPPANAEDVRDSCSIPGSGRPPGGGHGNPLQYSCLENPMGRGAWRAPVHGVAKSRSQLKRLSIYAHCFKQQNIFFFLNERNPENSYWIPAVWETLGFFPFFHWQRKDNWLKSLLWMLSKSWESPLLGCIPCLLNE